MNLEELADITLSNQDNTYSYNGKLVPRVTNILSKMIHEDYLLSWANSLGFKRKGYTKTVGEYADYGTKAHLGIECFLKGKSIPSDTPTISLDAFMRWWKIINENNTVRIVGQEVKLTCPYFGGTYDLLLEINGRIYIVDFKTSNQLSYKYCLQLAAYRYMLKYNNIADPAGIIILRLRKDIPDFEEFVLDFADQNSLDFIEWCEKTFLSLAYAYYHISKTESWYKDIVKEEGRI